MSELIIRAILKDEFTPGAEKILAEMKAMGVQGERAGDQIKNGMNTASTGVRGLTTETQKQGLSWTDLTAKYYLAAQALSVVSTATMAVVDASARYDSIKVRLDAFEGSAEAGARAMAKLQEMAKQPGLGLEQASSAYAALRALRESGPEAVAIIEAVAKANASMGGGAETFGRAMVQIQQILGKGKLMAEDINTISESIPNFRALIIDAFGTTDTQALNAKYSVQELMRGIQEAAAKLPPAGETIRNNMDNIGDAWTRLKASLGNTEVIKGATGALASFLDVLATANEKEEKGLANVRRVIGRENMGAFSKEGARGRAIAASASGGFENVAQFGSRMDMVTAMRDQFAQERTARQAEQDAKDKKLADERMEREKRDAAKMSKDRIDRIAGDVDIANERYNDGVKRRYQITQEIQKKALEADRKADDAYWAEKQKDEADFRKKFNANQKVAFEAYKRDEEAKTKATERELRRREALNAAIGGRIADITVQSLMVGFQPLDDIYSRMAARNADMEDSFTKTFQGIGLSFAAMLTKMAEEMAVKSAIFGLFSMFGGGGLLGGASSFIFGARASGGAMFPGVPYRFNEDRYGEGGEIFRPASAGTASPARNGSGGGGVQHVYNFAPGTSRADAGHIVRSIEQAHRERRRTVARAL